MIPKVSICIPAYKQVEYLRKTLKSVQIQTYQDYEIILTDDSPDEQVQDLVETFNFSGKLHYIKNKVALGSPENWNEAVRHAKGEYIKIMHHDEWFNYEDSLQTFVQMLDKNQAADFAFSAATGYHVNKNFRWFHTPTPEQLEQLRKNPRYLFFENFIGPPSSTIYRKKVNLSYDKRLKWVVDFDFYIRILLQNNQFEFSNRDLITSVSGATHNVTNECIDNKCVELREYLYLYEKISDHTDAIYIKQYVYLINKYKVRNPKEITDCGYEGIIPSRIKKAIVMNDLKHIKEKIVHKTKSVVKSTFLKPEIPSPGKAYQRVSYSQAGEDLIVAYIFSELGIQNPSYIDIGAHHPFYLSNTALFYENGSRGINIEPDPTLFKAFSEFRPADVNLNIGIAEVPGTLDFYRISNPELNTFSKEEAERYKEEGDFPIIGIDQIAVDTITHILTSYAEGKFPQFLTLDAEGIDEIVLNSINYDTNSPVVICVETISFSMSGNGMKNKAIIQFLESKGYLVYADTWINTIFVKKDIFVRDKTS